jgi:hypothetical protein
VPEHDLPKIGIYCASLPGDDLVFALQSIALNTTWPNFEMIVGTDPGPDDIDHRPMLDELAATYEWFDYIFDADRPMDRRGLGSPSDMLESLYRELCARGCTRFFQVNDDIAVTRHWLHEAEAIMQAMDGVGVVIPHDGLLCNNEGDLAGGFYYFSKQYVEQYHPHATAYIAEPVQCFWLDTEFCLRAAKHGRLRRAPRCCVMHLHRTQLPATTGERKPKRAVNSDSADDAHLFIERMRRERIDPWKYIPGLERHTPAEVLPDLESLRGIEPPDIDYTNAAPDELRPIAPPVPFARAAREHPDLPYFVSFPRTGSHWLRTFLEIYFDRPLLVRSFFPHPIDQPLLIHTHDLDDQVQDARATLYLYRGIVDTVFSQVEYEHGDAAGASWDDVERELQRYMHSLRKWLGDDAPAVRTHIVTYESLLDRPSETLAAVIRFLGGDVDHERIERLWAACDRHLVAERTAHDAKVIARGPRREDRRALFRYRHGARILDTIRDDARLARHLDPALLT